VAERLRQEVPDFEVYFAVDHQLLKDCLDFAGFRTLMTRSDHPSGTDRIAEANLTIGADQIINVQGDEPLVSARPFKTAADFGNPNQVKVVCDRAGHALYFSRSPLPYPRERQGQFDDAWVQANPCYRHLGLYAYKADLLQRFAALPVGRWEQIEKLEQLRVLENGFKIAVGYTDDPTIGVDTPDDADKFERLTLVERDLGAR
jgi:3-deoxy-manno-octulosonate cytidylyltransferase (CMP-KDO synthetase)